MAKDPAEQPNKDLDAKESEVQPPSEIDTLKAEITELRQKMIEQEHRPTHVFRNLFRSFLEKETKESKTASVYAAASLVGRWYFRRAVIVGGAGLIGGIIALGTLWFTWDTLKEFRKQNEYFLNQAIAQQRSTNTEILSTLLADIEAASEIAKRDSSGSWLLPKLLAYRVHSAARAFELYGNNSTSYERGQLVKALVDARVSFPLNPNPNFESAELKNANLRYANLRGAKLNYAQLRFAKLDSAKLDSAKLHEADLLLADLRGADLMRADLNDADLRGADLRGADIRGADLNRVDLSGARIGDARFRPVELRGADLRGADLRGADLRGAKLSNAKLSNANLSDAKLFGADLREADLRGTDLRGAYLNDAKNIKVKQLLNAYKLDKFSWLDPALYDSIMEVKPELFLHPDSVNRSN